MAEPQELSQMRKAEKQQASRAASELASRRQELGLDQRHEFAPVLTHTDEFGITHTRLQQKYQGVKVWGGDVIAHQNGNSRQAEATLAHKVMPDLNVVPAYDEKEALAIVHQDLAPQGAYTEEPTCELVVYPIEVQNVKQGRASKQELNAEDVAYEVSGVRLAYHIHTVLENGIDPLAHTDYLVDAHTGEVIQKWSTLMTEAVQGTANTQFGGKVKITTNKSGQKYELADPTRNGNYVTDMGRGTTGTGLLYSDKDNVWGDGAQYNTRNTTTSDNGQTGAADVAFGQQVTWDMFKNIFGQKGIRGENTATYIRVHYGKSNADAFYNDGCKCVSLGDAGQGLGDAYSIQTVAHELGHGFNFGSASLVYRGEPGGINEANSDILAAAAYFYMMEKGATGNALPATATQNDVCWDLFSQEGQPLRYMTKPSKDGRSRDAWSADLGNIDVHFSSGPGNRMFFFLTTGASSTPDTDYSSKYAPKGFAGIGPDKASRIWYRAMKNYLTTESKYIDARKACLNSARDLYGEGGKEYIAVENAFGAINVGSIHQGEPVTDTYTVSPAQVTLVSGATHNFELIKNGAPVKATWTIVSGGGAFNGSQYTAPQVASNTTVIVKGTSTLDGAKSATATVTVQPAPVVIEGDKLINGGFEQGSTGWSGTLSAIGRPGQKPLEGKVCAWLGGKGGNASESLYQAIEIPAGAKNANLSFYVHIETAEKTTILYDYLKVQVRDAKGNRLGTLATLSNADKNTGYDQKTLDLSAYKGKKVQLWFTSSEDRVNPTSFVLDKVSLAVN